jgi:hypothetical protein
MLERRRLLKTAICALVAVLTLCPLAARCDENLAVGFQFSATSPQGPDELTDISKVGVHFRTFYKVNVVDPHWRIVGEFGYNDFTLRKGAFADAIAPALSDSITSLFPLGPTLPAGSVATVDHISIDGGHPNAMHLTGGVEYAFAIEELPWLSPYLTAQGGLYSTGQSDTDLGLSVNVERPGGMADTTLSFTSMPFIRDDDRDNAFGLNFGGGAEISLTRILALVGDVRYHVAFTESKSTTFVDVGLGAVYYFGF